MLHRHLSLLAAVVLAVSASAQAPDSTAARADSVAAQGEQPVGEPGPTVTVPLPNGPGVFYYRAGSVGTSGVRPRPGRRVVRTAPTPAPTAAAPTADVEAAREALGLPPSARPRTAPVVEGVSRLDLLLLERDLLDAIDRRLARLAPGAAALPAAPGAPTIVVPGQPFVPPADAPPAAEPVRPVPPPVVVAPVVPPATPGPVTVETVERAILETGLFRTTTVNFEFARAALLPTAASTLDVLADVLRRYPALRVEVGGHTDSRGSDATNDALSQRRAESVRDYLVASGVASDRLTAVGYGERRPVATNDNETGRALNRRVEFVVLNPEAATSTREVPRVRDVIREELDRLRDDG